MKLVYVEWCDAIANGIDWISYDDAIEWSKKSEWIIREVGWLIEDTKEYISLASMWKPEDEYTVAQFKHLSKIPKTWIIKREEIKLEKGE